MLSPVEDSRVHQKDHLLDLLTARATEGLSHDDSYELKQAIVQQDAFDVNELELAAAAVYLAYDAKSGEHEPMPESLKERIRRTRMPSWGD